MGMLRGIFAGLALLGTAGAVAGQQWALPPMPNFAAYAAYTAGTCGAPSYGALGPGCYDCPPPCCDHVWAGYAQEKLVGFSRTVHRRAGRRCSGACRHPHPGAMHHFGWHPPGISGPFYSHPLMMPMIEEATVAVEPALEVEAVPPLQKND